MTSRKKIEKFCKENGISINSLVYDRNYEYAYGDCSNESEWIIDYLFNGEELQDHSYTADELIEELQETINQTI